VAHGLAQSGETGRARRHPCWLLVAGAAAQKVLLKWGPASLSGLGHDMAGHEGSQSNFRVPESRIEPTATPF
jgi:hypothetical protein